MAVRLPRRRRIALAAARRIAIAAQGFGEPGSASEPDARALHRLVRRLGVLQLDSVNVFCRAHYMPLFSRLGPYRRELLDGLAGHEAGAGRRNGRRLFEYWGHQASLLPIETQPLWRWRMARADVEAWSGVSAIARERPDLLDRVMALVAERGPIRAADTGIAPTKRAPGEMWNWHDGKTALEYLFYAGRVAAAGRRNFERFYDLPERILPASILESPAPEEDEAQRELMRISARALGIATEPDLGDYFRLPRKASKARVAELVASGELVPVQVTGWTSPAYLWHRAARPRDLHARALLSPFDSLIWFRDRTERLFDVRYRIEIYTPAHRRVHGYYVLPFLLGDSLVARVDLKSDRRAGVLRVQGAFAEPGIDRRHVARELACELRRCAAWLGLGEVAAAAKGDLASDLRAALA
ncbi:MAG: winged helix-turn-helix domain-containing protein [Solirubrobacteraceae bacterium]